mmetsp:Transcript_7399/g.12466  ORF Transcript_7399/g.12466 Transcript_7399/m.12466 type:complete len:317 (-) Transcript_7399:34-984(-)
MPRPLTKRFIVGMGRPRQDLGKSACRLGPIHLVEPQGILILLIKADRTLCAINFISIAHFPARRDAAEKHLTHGTIFEPAHDLRLVIIVHCATGAGGMHRFDLGNQARDRADQRQCPIDHMRGQIAHGAIGHARRAPCGRGLRIGIKVFGMLTAKPGHIPDLTRCDQLARKLAGRRTDIVEPDHIHASAGVGRSNHGAAVVQRCTQRFFAEYRLAQGKGGFGHGTMRGLRCGDHNRLDLWVIDQALPIIRRAGEPIRCPIPFRRFGRAGAHHFQPGAQRGVENRADRGHRNSMGLAHISPAKNANSYLRHVSPNSG